MLPDDADSYIDIPSSLFLNISGNGKDHCTLKRNRFTWAVVKALSGVNCAKELLVEPLTVEDWELLELYALGLEEGGLLQQVSIVYAGQVLKLRLSNGAEACVCVLPGNFEHTNPVWPDDNAALPCLRLVAETRVNVAPKPRAKVGSLRLVPTREDYIKDPSILELAVRLNVNVVSVSQGTGVVNPNTMAKMRGRQTTEIDGIFDLVRLVASREAADAAADEPDSKSAIVRVSTSIDIPEGCIGKILYFLYPLKQRFR